MSIEGWDSYSNQKFIHRFFPQTREKRRPKWKISGSVSIKPSAVCLKSSEKEQFCGCPSLAVHCIQTNPFLVCKSKKCVYRVMSHKLMPKQNLVLLNKKRMENYGAIRRQRLYSRYKL